MFVGNALNCNKLNERKWSYDMVDFPDIHILRDTNYVHAMFRWGGEDYNLYLLKNMNTFKREHVLLCQKDTNTYDEHDA